MSNFSFTKIDPISGLPGATEYAGNCQECSGKRSFGKTDWNNFGPRIGFAWRPMRNWVLRGAYGIMYEADTFNGLYGVIPGGLGGGYGGTYNLAAAAIEPWRGVFNWDNGFPTQRYTPSKKDPSFSNRNVTYGTDPEYGRNPYIQSWNLNLQRQLFSKIVVDIGYVGRKGTALRQGGSGKSRAGPGVGSRHVRPQSQQHDPERGRRRGQRSALSLSWFHGNSGQLPCVRSRSYTGTLRWASMAARWGSPPTMRCRLQ